MKFEDLDKAKILELERLYRIINSYPKEMIGNRFDYLYITYILTILMDGYISDNRTSERTAKIPGVAFYFDLGKEFPILRCKEVKTRSVIYEMIWIYLQGRNDLKFLHDNNIHFWDKWDIGDGTIGHTYGYIINKFDQVNKVITALKENPQDRRIRINLWDNEEVEKGIGLPPCIDSIDFDVSYGKLNATVMQRSGDMMLGVPFDITQMAILISVIAKLSGLKLGYYKHFINNAHIYENALDGALQTVKQYFTLLGYEKNITDSLKHVIDINDSNLKLKNESKPMLDISNIKPEMNIKDVKYDDIKILNYENNHMPFIKMEVVE